MSTLIALGIYTLAGSLAAFLVAWGRGLFAGLGARFVLMTLCDSFFTVGILTFCWGVLIWTANGGIWDGLTFTFKTAFGRIRRDFESERKTFADYQKEREAKARSPRNPLLGGLILIGIAFVIYLFYRGA